MAGTSQRREQIGMMNLWQTWSVSFMQPNTIDTTEFENYRTHRHMHTFSPLVTHSGMHKVYNVI